jgi:hypothetical protein
LENQLTLGNALTSFEVAWGILLPSVCCYHNWNIWRWTSPVSPSWPTVLCSQNFFYHSQASIYLGPNYVCYDLCSHCSGRFDFFGCFSFQFHLWGMHEFHPPHTPPFTLTLGMFMEYQSSSRLSFAPKAWVHVWKLTFEHTHLSRGP